MLKILFKPLSQWIRYLENGLIIQTKWVLNWNGFFFSFLCPFVYLCSSFSFPCLLGKWKEVKIDGALCYIEHCAFFRECVLCVCVWQTVCHTLFVIRNTLANRQCVPFSALDVVFHSFFFCRKEKNDIGVSRKNWCIQMERGK